MSILLDLVKYLGILFLGGILGSKLKINKEGDSKLDVMQNICLLFLLFVMGLSIGSDPAIVANIFSIGGQALIISIFTIIFSIIFVRISRLIFEIKVKEDDSNDF